MLYDTFILYESFQLLEIRLNILKDVVDKFIIIESNKNINNNYKKLNFDKYKEKLTQELLDKIIYIPITSIDIDKRENYFNKHFSFLNELIESLDNNDYIMFSDESAIPSPEKIIYYIQNFPDKINIFNQNVYDCYLNTIAFPNKKWQGTILTTISKVKKITPQLIWKYNNSDDVVYEQNGGWYFSNIGIKQKSIYILNQSLDNLPTYIQENKDYYNNLLYVKNNNSKIIVFENDILSRIGVKININQAEYIYKHLDFIDKINKILYVHDYQYGYDIYSVNINHELIVTTLNNNLEKIYNCKINIPHKFDQIHIFKQNKELKILTQHNQEIKVYEIKKLNEVILSKNTYLNKNNKYKIISLFYDEDEYICYLKNGNDFFVAKLDDINDFISIDQLVSPININILKDKISNKINIDILEIKKYNEYYLMFNRLYSGNNSDIICQVSNNSIDFIPPTYNIFPPYISNIKNKYPIDLKTFYGDNDIFHFVLYDDNNIYIYKNKRDSIFSLDSNDGSITIGPFNIINKNININAKIFVDGYINIGLLDNNKQIISEYNIDDSMPLIGDNHNFIVQWNNNSKKDNFSYYITLSIKNAKIYSFFL